jgi:tetraacyldisaccharide 4'-kinase
MGCNVIVADDGLQHYRLRRDFEIAVIDGQRGFGNRRLLPAGPLREPVDRLRAVNRIMVQGSGEVIGEVQGSEFPGVTQFELAARHVHNLGGKPPVTLEAFRGKSVHAVAAIGNPRRFFDLLREHGIDVIPHELTDHAALTPADLRFEDRLAVLMTEKDAVKCGGFAQRDCWYVTVDLILSSDADTSWLDSLVEQVKLRL